MLPGGRQLGGAPANFAYHAGALGAEARVVSRLGRDVDGRELVARLAQLGIGTACIDEDPLAPTSTVTVSLGADGQPCYTIHKNVAWDRLAGEAVATAGAVYFGTLAQRSETSRRTIRTLFGLVPPTSLRIFDVNLRQHYHSRAIIEESLALADVLKLDETELPRLAAMFHLSGDERARVDALARLFALRVVAFPRGGRGSLLRAAGEWSVHPGRPTIVADTVGAGDSFTAAIALSLLAGWPLDPVKARATALAADVCSQPGATPLLPELLRAPFLAK
jgi:fructokinase